MGRAGPWVLGVAVATAVIFALWSNPRGPAPLGRGAQAPDFALPRLPGAEPLALQELRGRVVLLNFWATWCGPCEAEMPAMQRLHAKLAPQGLSLLGVSVDESDEAVERFRERLGLDFTLLWDPERRVSELYQTFRYPETFLIDGDGQVVERYVGPREWDAPEYEARIRRLLEGESEPS